MDKQNELPERKSQNRFIPRLCKICSWISKLVGVLYNYKKDPANCAKKINIKSNLYLTEWETGEILQLSLKTVS